MTVQARRAAQARKTAQPRRASQARKTAQPRKVAQARRTAPTRIPEQPHLSAPERVAALRRLMRREGLHAYLVPSTDPHQSEYVPDCWRRRAWLTGFSGSAGDALVTLREAGLWTDGRYFRIYGC